MARTSLARRRSLSPIFGSFSKEMENLLERFFGDNHEPFSDLQDFLPSLNVAETDGVLEVSVDIPGVKAEDIHVELSGKNLVISGHRDEEQEEKDKHFHRIERSHGEFRRSVPLPCAVDQEQIDAKYEDGVLKVTLPKSVEDQPKKIQVKS